MVDKEQHPIDKIIRDAVDGSKKPIYSGSENWDKPMTLKPGDIRKAIRQLRNAPKTPWVR